MRNRFEQIFHARFMRIKSCDANFQPCGKNIRLYLFATTIAKIRYLVFKWEIFQIYNTRSYATHPTHYTQKKKNES